MRIQNAVFHKIREATKDIFSEIGGILGSKKDDVISDIIIEIKYDQRICCYEPDVEFFNKHISKWEEDDIKFEGIFHTHFAGIKTLSSADIKYIHCIMRNMPDEIKNLYFPIFILPDQELVCYRAQKEKNKIKIYNEDLIII